MARPRGVGNSLSAADPQPRPASARTAHHSPSPNIYGEAGRGILFWECILDSFMVDK